MLAVNRQSLRDIGHVQFDAELPADPLATEHAPRLVRNRRRVGEGAASSLHLLIQCGDDDAELLARAFVADNPMRLDDIHVQRLEKKNAKRFTQASKVLDLELAPLGGQSKRVARMALRDTTLRLWRPSSTFIEPFTGGIGTTCGEWTRVIKRAQQGKLLRVPGEYFVDADGVPIEHLGKEVPLYVPEIRGFVEGKLTGGVCPVCSPFCYLGSAPNDMAAMAAASHLEDCVTVPTSCAITTESTSQALPKCRGSLSHNTRDLVWRPRPQPVSSARRACPRRAGQS